MSGIVPTGLNHDFFSERYFYDEFSKQIFKQVFGTNEDELKEINVVTDAQYLDVLEFIQSELNKININLKIEITPPSILRQEKQRGNMIFLGQVG